MRPLPSVLIMLAIVLTAVGAALFIAGPPPASAPAPSEPRVAEPMAVAPVSPAPSGTPVVRRGGRVLPLAEAIKELDLIKPPRQKLADDFTVPTPAGARFRLGEHRGKVVMV